MANNRNGNRNRNRRSAQGKRGAPYGNKNAAGRHRRTGGGTQGGNNGGTITSQPAIEPGSDDDPVIQGFEAKKQQVSEQYQALMEGIQNAQNAYMQSVATMPTMGRGTPSLRLPDSNVPMTTKGTPDQRTAAGRAFMASHPHFQPAVAHRAD